MRLYDKRPPHDVAYDLVKRRIDKARFHGTKADFGLEPDEKYSDHFELEPIAEKTSSMTTDREYASLQWGVRVNGRPAGRVRNNYEGTRHKFVPGWYKDEDVYDPAVHGEPEPQDRPPFSRTSSDLQLVSHFTEGVTPLQQDHPPVRRQAAGPVQQLKLFHHPHEPRGLANPIGGHEWYHGSPHRFSEFADPASHHPLMYEQDPDDTTHWNSLLGTHFAADRQVAHAFSKGEHENTGGDSFLDHFTSDEPSQHVIHARLNIRRPKHYESEHDMDQEVYEHEWKAGNHPEKHLTEGENDWDDYAGEAGEQTLMHYGGHSDRMRTKSDADPLYFNRQRQYHPYATGWLNHHPEKYEIAQRFRQRLEKQGYDGITYGNEFEQSDVDHPESSMSAIAFHPHQITIQRHFRGNQPDPSMAHEGATAGPVSRLATPLPAGVRYEDEPMSHSAAFGDPFERGQGPYMPNPEDEHLRDHLTDRHGLDPDHWRFGDIAHWRRWHRSEHTQTMHENHQHQTTRGLPFEEKYPDVHRIEGDAPDVLGQSGGRAREPWNRGKPLETGEFVPTEMRYQSSLVEAGQRGDMPELEYYHVRQGKERGGYHAVAAAHNGTIIGHLTWGPGHRQINQLWVHPEYRRRGVAEAIHQRALWVDPGLQHHIDRTDAGDAWARSVSTDVPERKLDSTADDAERKGAWAAQQLQERLDSGHPTMQRLAAWAPSSGIFGPTTGLDQDLFEGDDLRPVVREAVFEKLDQALRVDGSVAGSDWQDWLRVYLAGGSASEWAGPRPGDQGARDLDILIGVNYERARDQSGGARVLQPPGAGGVDLSGGLSDAEIDGRLNRALQEHFNDQAWRPASGGTWSLTGYVNPHAWDITALKPYAAYDLTNMKWSVRPPHLPGHSAADFPQALLAQARAVASEARAVLRLPEPFRTQQARAMWERLHAERRRAFSIEGEGWVDPGNVIEKFLAYSRGHILEKIRDLALA